MSTQNINVARFARNFEWDFFCDFQTLWPFWHLLRLFSNFLYGMKLLLKVANFLIFWNIVIVNEKLLLWTLYLSIRDNNTFLGQREQTVNDPLRSHFLTNLSKNNWFSRPFSFQEPLRFTTTPQESRSIRPYDVILDNRATIEEESEWQPIYK